MPIILALLAGSIMVSCAAYRRYRSTAREVAGKPGLDLLGSVFVGNGVSLPVVVLLFLAWMRDPRHYSWVISGPYPLDRLGGGPFQLWTAILGVVFGCTFLSLGLIIRSYASSSPR